LELKILKYVLRKLLKTVLTYSSIKMNLVEEALCHNGPQAKGTGSYVQDGVLAPPSGFDI